MDTASDMSYRTLSLILGAFLLLAAGMAMAAPTVRFSTPPWPGVEVETEVVSQIFEAMGYQTETVPAAPTLGIKSVSTGEVDIVLAVWIPSQKSTLESVMAEGNIAIAGTELDDALYGIVVPDYVWEAGVHSIADLHKYPEKFGKVIYGINPGSDGNLLVKEAIHNGTYNLKGWRVVPSTTAAMLVQAQRKIRQHEWVAFLGWRPHWMNIAMDIKYLKDPKKIWGGGYRILMIANKEFLKKHPEIDQFLEQFEVTADTQSTWIYKYSFKHIDKSKVATHWISHHMDQVRSWLEGISAVNGKPAAQVVSQAFKS